MAIGVIANDETNKLKYHDDVNKYYDNSFHISLDDDNESHALIVKQVTKHSKVLDVGCSHGLIGEALVKYLDCEVYGIELDKEAAKIARQLGCYKKIDSFDITNASTKDYQVFFRDNKDFDYIIFSDVLEHLLCPHEVMFQFGKLLKTGGKILISLPNIAHYDVIHGLLNEKFNYAQMGILDNTHLRFFTKYSFAEYVLDANKAASDGFIFDLECVGNTKIMPHFIDKYPFLTELINKNPDLVVLQNIFKLEKIADNQVTGKLNSLVKEKHQDIAREIDTELASLYHEITKIKEENDKIKEENDHLKENNYNLLNNYNLVSYEKTDFEAKYYNVINSRSWQYTAFIRNFKDAYQHYQVKKYCQNDNKKKNILFFIHSWLDINNLNSKTIGGTTLHLLDLILKTSDIINSFIITVMANKYVLVSFVNGKQCIYDLGIPVRVHQFDDYDYTFYETIMEIIENLQIDLIHMHHILNFPCDLQLIAQKRKTIFTVHDYTTICPTFFLIDQEKKYCTLAKSTKCLDCCYGLNLRIRNEAVANLFKHTEKVIVPDQSVKEEIKKYYDVTNFVVIPNGVDLTDYEKFNYVKKNTNKIKNVAAIGIVNDHKGSNYIKKMILNNDPNIVYHLFGDSEDEFFKKERPNYCYHGVYDNRNLPKLLNDYHVDLVLMLSICPESFSYVLSEVMVAKIPVITFDIGAIGNRVKSAKIGPVLPYHSSYQDVIQGMLEALKPKNYQKYLENYKLNKIPSTTDTIQEIVRVYKEYLGNNSYNYKLAIKYLDKYKVLYIL